MSASSKPIPGGPHHADRLSFMSRRARGAGVNCWDVRSAGNYTADVTAGSLLADEYLAFIGEFPTYGNHTLLTSIVREMIEQAKAGGEWTGVHVGFLARVNGHAMAMAALAARHCGSALSEENSNGAA